MFQHDFLLTIHANSWVLMYSTIQVQLKFGFHDYNILQCVVPCCPALEEAAHWLHWQHPQDVLDLLDRLICSLHRPFAQFLCLGSPRLPTKVEQHQWS